jgi:hypothetical protein
MFMCFAQKCYWKGNCASYNFLTTLFVISVSHLARNILFLACYREINICCAVLSNTVEFLCRGTKMDRCVVTETVCEA